MFVVVSAQGKSGLNIQQKLGKIANCLFDCLFVCSGSAWPCDKESLTVVTIVVSLSSVPYSNNSYLHSNLRVAWKR